MGNQHCCREKRKGLEKIPQRPLQSAGQPGQWRNGLVARPCGPEIAALPAGGMCGQDDLHQPEGRAERQQLELDGHRRAPPDVLRASDPGLITVRVLFAESLGADHLFFQSVHRSKPLSSAIRADNRFHFISADNRFHFLELHERCGRTCVRAASRAQLARRPPPTLPNAAARRKRVARAATDAGRAAQRPLRLRPSPIFLASCERAAA